MLRIELSYSITTYHIKDKCNEEHAENLLRSIMIMLNETWINEKAKAEEFIEKTIQIIEVMKNA
jgi:hypothetical protein